MKLVGIYGLQNKSDPNKWYVGQSVDIISRWKQYKKLNCATQHKLHRALTKHGFTEFNTVILEDCPNNRSVLNDREIYWIQKLNSVECGYNIQLGGASVSPKFTMRGKLHSNEAKKKMSASALGKRKSEEHRTNISRARVGIKFGEETIKKMSAAGLGAIRTEEHRHNISESLIGNKRCVGKKNRLGKKHSVESKEKMRLASVGNTNWLGKKRSEETKEKIRKSLLRYNMSRNGVLV